MADIFVEEPARWFDQARADLQASSQVKGCHKRYLLQQSYEKSVKCLILASVELEGAHNKAFRSAVLQYVIRGYSPILRSSRTTDTAIRKAYGKDPNRCLLS